MEALLKLPIVSSVHETKNLRDLYDKIEANIRSLKALGVESESFGNLLVPVGKYAQNFILSLQSFKLTPTIDKPTRVHHNSYSLIDNIFASNLEDTITSGNIISDLTDHFSHFVFLTLLITSLTSKVQIKMPLRDFSNYSEAKFLNELSQLDLTGAVSGLNDVNKSFSVFYDKLNKLLNRHAPFKPISKPKKKKFLKQWVTKGIRKSIKIIKKK